MGTLVLTIFASLVIPDSVPNVGKPEKADLRNSGSLYVEMGGPGFFSLNAEGRVFHPALSLRLGLSWLLLAVGFVFGGSILSHPHQSHHLELGLGIADLTVANFFGGDQDTITLPWALIGYRYEPPKKGLMFRLAFTPLFFVERTNTWDPGRGSVVRTEVRVWTMVGFALGYRFRVPGAP